METSTGDNAKTRKQRATQTGTLVGTRLQPEMLEELDGFRAQQRPIPTRPEAMRHLAAIGLETIPIIADFICFLETQTDDPESVATAKNLRKIISRK